MPKSAKGRDVGGWATELRDTRIGEGNSRDDKTAHHAPVDEGPDRAHEPLPRAAPVGRRRPLRILPDRRDARGRERIPAALPGAPHAPRPVPLVRPFRLIGTEGEAVARGPSRRFPLLLTDRMAPNHPTSRSRQ